MFGPWLSWIARPLVAVGVLAAWIAYVEIAQPPSFFFPHPTEVLSAFVKILSGGVLLRHGLATLQAALGGFALGACAAFVIGGAISRSALVERILRPYLIASQTTPIIVLAPLFLVWFGFGLASKLMIAAILCFFPVLVNVVSGLRSFSADELKLFRSMRASRWQQLVYLEVPSALPFIFAGLRIASVLCVIGAVVGEFVGARAGLGYLALTAAGNLETETVFVAVFVLMALGLSLYGLVTIVERRVLFWR